MSKAASAKCVALLLLAFGAGVLVTTCLLKRNVVGQLALSAPKPAWAATPVVPPNPYVALCLSVKGESLIGAVSPAALVLHRRVAAAYAALHFALRVPLRCSLECSNCCAAAACGSSCGA